MLRNKNIFLYLAIKKHIKTNDITQNRLTELNVTGQYAQEIYMLFLVHRLFLYKCNYANELHMLYASKCIVKVSMLMNFAVHEW
jgi:hypothetical protein